MSWSVVLADRAPIDLVVTVGYLGAVGATVRAAVRPGMQPRDRTVWVIAAGLLVVLVLNQQTDLHRLLIRRADRFVVDRGLSVLGPEVVAVALMGVFVAATLVVALLWLLSRRQLPPGRLAGAGLVVLAVHALGRIAMFSHLLRGEWMDRNAPLALKAAEVLGLALVVVGALQWRGHRTTAGDQARGTSTSGSPDPSAGTAHTSASALASRWRP
jgi:hypothetical protein